MISWWGLELDNSRTYMYFFMTRKKSKILKTVYLILKKKVIKNQKYLDRKANKWRSKEHLKTIK